MGLFRQRGCESGAHVAKTARFGVRSTRPVDVTMIYEVRAGQVLRCRLAPCTNSPRVAWVEIQRSVNYGSSSNRGSNCSNLMHKLVHVGPCSHVLAIAVGAFLHTLMHKIWRCVQSKTARKRRGRGTGVIHGETEAGHAPFGVWCSAARGDATAKLMIGLVWQLYAF